MKHTECSTGALLSVVMKTKGLSGHIQRSGGQLRSCTINKESLGTCHEKKGYREKDKTLIV